MRAATGLLLALIGLGACAPASPSPGEQGSAGPSPLPAALELLDCDGPPSDMGGIGPFGVVTLGSTPAEALASWLADPAFVVPINDWELNGTAGDRAVFVYRAAERIKIVAVFSTATTEPGEGIFGLAELRACDEAEFGPDAVFATGDRVWTNEAGLILRDAPGPAHCGWQHARLLHIGIDFADLRQYIGDPLGIMPTDSLLEPYDGDATLPDDASPSGYRSKELELWLVPDGRAIFVLGPGRVELWPRSDPPIGCT